MPRQASDCGASPANTPVPRPYPQPGRQEASPAINIPCIKEFNGFHEGPITSANISHSGLLLATASRDKHAKLYSLSTNSLIRTLKGHLIAVRSVEFSPSNRLLATSSDDETANLWHVASGASVLTFVGHKGWVNSAVFSPDGNEVLTGPPADNTAKIWDAETGRCSSTLYSGEGLFDARFSPDGAMVVTGSRDGVAQIWEAGSGAPIRKLRHDKWVHAACFSSDGALVATGGVFTGPDDCVKVWDVGTGECVKKLTRHAGNVFDVDFSPNGNLLVTASEDKTVKVWNWETEKCMQTLGGHGGRVFSARFARDGSMLATGSFDETARVWGTKDLKCGAPEVFFTTMAACYERGLGGENSLQKLEPFVKDLSEFMGLNTLASLAQNKGEIIELQRKRFICRVLERVADNFAFNERMFDLLMTIVLPKCEADGIIVPKERIRFEKIYKNVPILPEIQDQILEETVALYSSHIHQIQAHHNGRNESATRAVSRYAGDLRVR